VQLVGAARYSPALFTEVAQNYTVPHRPGAIDTQVAKYLAGARPGADGGRAAWGCAAGRPPAAPPASRLLHASASPLGPHGWAWGLTVQQARGTCCARRRRGVVACGCCVGPRWWVCLRMGARARHAPGCEMLRGWQTAARARARGRSWVFHALAGKRPKCFTPVRARRRVRRPRALHHAPRRGAQAGPAPGARAPHDRGGGGVGGARGDGGDRVRLHRAAHAARLRGCGRVRAGAAAGAPFVPHPGAAQAHWRQCTWQEAALLVLRALRGSRGQRAAPAAPRMLFAGSQRGVAPSAVLPQQACLALCVPALLLANCQGSTRARERRSASDRLV